jgi:hypothetical protein
VWRTALAASLPLLLGILSGITTATTATADEWDSWEEEIYITGIVSVDSEMDLLTTPNEREEEMPQ